MTRCRARPSAARGSPPLASRSLAVVTAGTSDLPVAREALRTLAFYGLPAREIADVGVAGLWRILQHEEELRRYPAVIVVAGMEGALFSVVGGLVRGVVIAVPTSTGYGAAPRGRDGVACRARQLRARRGHGQHRQRLRRRLRSDPGARHARAHAEVGASERRHNPRDEKHPTPWTPGSRSPSPPRSSRTCARRCKGISRGG